jgi:hypothetical protein
MVRDLDFNEHCHGRVRAEKQKLFSIKETPGAHRYLVDLSRNQIAFVVESLQVGGLVPVTVPVGQTEPCTPPAPRLPCVAVTGSKLGAAVPGPGRHCDSNSGCNLNSCQPQSQPGTARNPKARLWWVSVCSARVALMQECSHTQAGQFLTRVSPTDHVHNVTTCLMKVLHSAVQCTAFPICTWHCQWQYRLEHTQGTGDVGNSGTWQGC